MTFVSQMKMKLESINPFAIRRRNKMQSKLKNKNMTFLTPNCLGGILFHDLGVKFYSPTVNTMMTQCDFVKFVMRIDYYLSKKLVFFSHPEYTCPCAWLGDLVIHFSHYESESEAENKWNERIKRVNYKNLFIFAEERDGLTKQDIQALGKIEARGIVVFTAHEYSDIPYTLFIPKYKQEGEVGNILKKNYWNDSREYEDYFDFVKWFNESNGEDYNITPYIRQ